MKNKHSWKLESEKDLQEIMNDFVGALEDRRLLFFYAEMGAGKTTFIKALCHHLGVDGEVVSPTFGIVNEYCIKASGNPVYHIDLYRLENLQEALDIGIEEYMFSGSYCMVEWPQIVEPLVDSSEVAVIKIVDTPESTGKILLLS